MDPVQAAAHVDSLRRAQRPFEARDALHAALPYFPQDPTLCHAGGVLYLELGYAHEALRFFELVERSSHPTLAKDATERLSLIAREGTTGARDAAICVLTLAEIYGALFTPYARQWPLAHWADATLRDPCWVLAPNHLVGTLSGGHATPPGHTRAFWTVRYAIEALDAGSAAASLGGRFPDGEILVYLETDATTLPMEEPTDRDLLGTTALRRATAFERVTDPVDVALVRRVYVAGVVADPIG